MDTNVGRPGSAGSISNTENVSEPALTTNTWSPETMTDPSPRKGSGWRDISREFFFFRQDGDIPTYVICVRCGVIDTCRAITVCPRSGTRDKRPIGLNIVGDQLVPVKTVGLKVAKRRESDVKYDCVCKGVSLNDLLCSETAAVPLAYRLGQGDAK